MTKAWRVVLWIVLALLAAGIVLAGAGWLTGASPLRMAEQLFGGVDEVQAAVNSIAIQAEEVLTELHSAI